MDVDDLYDFDVSFIARIAQWCNVGRSFRFGTLIIIVVIIKIIIVRVKVIAFDNFGLWTMVRIFIWCFDQFGCFIRLGPCIVDTS